MRLWARSLFTRKYPPPWPDEVAKHREALFEIVIDQDEVAMEAYLEGVEPDIATLKECIRRGTVTSAFVPVLAGSAFKNKCVQPLLDAVVDYLPSPTEVGNIKGVGMDGMTPDERVPSDEAPVAGACL